MGTGTDKAEQMIGEMEQHVEAEDRCRQPMGNPPAPDRGHWGSDEISGGLRPDRDREPDHAPDDFVGDGTVNQGLDDAEEDIERRRSHAGIGQAPRPYSGGGTKSEREPQKRHDERDGQDEDRADDRKGRTCCGL